MLLFILIVFIHSNTRKMKTLTISEKTKQRIFDKIKEQFEADAIELLECFPASLGFTVHSENRTFHGWFTWDGRLSKAKQITEEN